MSFVTAVITFVLLAAFPAALIFTWYRCHVRLREKGFGRFPITTCFLITLIASFYLLSTAGNDVLTVFGAPLVWMLLAIVVARVAPRRAGSAAASQLGERRAGRRTALRPLAFAWLATLAGGAMTLFFLWQMFSPTIVPRDEGWIALIAAFATTLTVSRLWFKVAGRAKAAPLTIEPSEASVLYLRAFNEEKRPFAVGPRSVLRQYTSQWVAHAPFTRGDPTIKLTLEDFLEESITAQLGPFVGLGNPHDRLHPDGAVREYAPDDIWQKRFLDLAHSAKCIVVSIGGSANLQWELAQIKQHGLIQKLCLFTTPRIRGSESGIINTLRRARAKRDRELAATWDKSIDVLRRAGYECDAACPGAGAAVTFDGDGKSMLLTADATSPEEFITPVADWFKTGRRTGKCGPVECRSCHGTTYVVPGAETEGVVCFACRIKAERAAMSVTERDPVLWAVFASVVAIIALVALDTSSAWVFWLTWLAVMVAPLPIKTFLRSVRQRRARRIKNHQTVSRDAVS